MQTALVLALVFVAVTIAAKAIIPMFVSIGLRRAEALSQQGEDTDPLQRFMSPRDLAQTCWTGAVFGGILGGALFVALGILNPVIVFLAVVVFASVIFQLPRAWLKFRVAKRQLAFEEKLMDLTLGLSNGLRSGAALPQTLETISRDMGGVMAEEIGLLLHEYRLGVDLGESLARLCKRMPGEDLQILMTAVRITMQAGGSLAEVLEKITDVIRQRTEFQQKLRTMTAQGRFEAIAMAAAPLAAFCLMYMIDPSLMKPLVTTKLGWYSIGGVMVLEIIGFLWIRKIVTIEV